MSWELGEEQNFPSFIFLSLASSFSGQKITYQADFGSSLVQRPSSILGWAGTDGLPCELQVVTLKSER